MAHPMHDRVVEAVTMAIALMDRFLRDRIDLGQYAEGLKELEVDDILATNKKDFQQDVGLVYYLDALMLLSSLQQELDFQVAEYGANVALEDMRNLQELMGKFPAH